MAEVVNVQYKSIGNFLHFRAVPKSHYSCMKIMKFSASVFLRAFNR